MEILRLCHFDTIMADVQQDAAVEEEGAPPKPDGSGAQTTSPHMCPCTRTPVPDLARAAPPRVVRALPRPQPAASCARGGWVRTGARRAWGLGAHQG